MKVARGHKAVAAVVARTRDHEHGPVGSARVHGVRDRPAGVLHEHQPRKAVLVDDALVDRTHPIAINGAHVPSGGL
jgi:hypothetical protein